MSVTSSRAGCGGLALAVCSLALFAGPSVPELAAASGVGALGRVQPKHGVRHINGPSEFVNVVGKLLVEEGDRVRVGQILAQLDDLPSWEAQAARLRASLAAVEAGLPRLRVAMEKARRDLERSEKLFADGLLPPSERDTAQVALQQAETELASATAELAVARAALDESRVQIERRLIRSPLDGQVLEIHVRSGEKVGERGILELAQTDQMYVFAEVYETDVPRIEVGQRATATSPVLGQALSGVVERIGRKVERKGIFDDDPGARKDARVVDVQIRLDDSTAASAFTNLQVEVRFEP